MSSRWSLAPLCCLLLAGAARADDTNLRPYLIGGRAAGMGGAFTALADDGTGAYYNPGGLAFAKRSSITLSGSVYGVVKGSYAGLLPNTTGGAEDFNFSALNLFPTSTSAVRKLAGGDVLHAEVMVPDALRIDERQSILAAANAFAFALETQTLWLGGGWSRRFGRVGLGASVHALINSSTTQLDFNVINAQDPGRFIVVSSREDVSTVGLVGSLGARLEVTDELHLGASLFLPALGWGSRKEFVRAAFGRNVTTDGNPSTVVHTNSDLTATPSTPLRAQLGVAFTRDRLTFAADAILLGPRDTNDNPEQAGIGLNRRLIRKTTFNFSVGGEYLVDEHVPVRAGFFTDLAASPSPEDLGAGEVPANSLHVNRYGFTASAGYQAEHVTTDVGVNVSFGSGTEYLPAQLDFSRLQPAGATQLYTYIFLSTAYEF